MTTQRLFATVALGLFLGFRGRRRRSTTSPRSTCPARPGPQSTGIARTRLRESSMMPSGNTHGFVLSNGVYTTIDVPGAVSTSVNGINANGELAGIYDDGARFSRLFLEQGRLHHARPARLDPHASRLPQRARPGRGSRTAMPSNRRVTASSGARASSPRSTCPDDDPLFGTVAFGINDHGEIVGDYVDARWQPPRLRAEQGRLHDARRARFHVHRGRGNQQPRPDCGLYFDADGNEHGFVLCNGVYTTIDVPGSTATAVFSINAKGEIVGSYDDADGVTHGFVGTPAH